jgi:hypothetical protein
MNKLDIGYAVLAYNRPHYLTATLLSLRDQIIERNRPIYFFVDGSANSIDAVDQKVNITIFEEYFRDYNNKKIIVRDEHLGAEINFRKLYQQMFDEFGHDNICILEDDLFLEHVYLNNVENLLECFYHDPEIGSVSGFTRQTILSNYEDLQQNMQTAVVQHNLIGSIYKRNVWDLIKPVFEEWDIQHHNNKNNISYIKFKSGEIDELSQHGVSLGDPNDTPDKIMLKNLNEKFNIHMPHLSYDKIVDHMLRRHRIFRVSTYNRYLTHIGWMGTSAIKSNKLDNQDHIRQNLRHGIIGNMWNRLTTDTTKLTKNFTFDKQSHTNLSLFHCE